MLTVLLPVLFLLPHTAQGITKEGVGAVGEACSMGSGVRGRCQEVGACLKEGGVVVMGEQVQLCSPTPSDIIVCCRKPHLVAENLCAAWAQHWRSPAGHCIDKTNLIVGGVNADPGEYPHVANLTERVLPACLPTDPSQDLVGHELTVIGWGHTQFGHRVLSRILQKVNVPVVDQLECQFKYPDYLGRDTPKGILKDQLCAGKTGRDSCKGDSGGPIIDQKERGGSRCEHTVEGIVSFGRGCGELGVYTRVSSYLDWITGHIAPGDY
ncbi:tryptase-2-like isoform X3 [Eriocheir sinensis]|uniref:tryptase-2-like isoform X3 n=1 Tax=Eriocheir sinensis TaxID=95602 RepID=UPI0021C79C23|nr:tryptase-2-like isoform X3 [Eriocheir sinensis]